jgi:hypothetical protein
MRSTRRFSVPLVSGLLLLSLSGCGITRPERVTGGAALGAATGAIVGTLGGPVGVGAAALIGTAAGAGMGLLTDPHTINLGRPPLHRTLNRVLQ